MAHVTRENIGVLHDRLIVKLTKDEYYPSFEKKLKEAAKTGTVPGFRKGKVPPNLVKKMAGQNIFKDEVMRNVTETVKQFVHDERMVLFGQPILDTTRPFQLDMNTTSDIEIALEIGLKPDFAIPALDDKATIKSYKIPVSDELLESEIINLGKRVANEVERDYATFKDDVIHYTIEECDRYGKPTRADNKEKTKQFDQFPVKFQGMLRGKKQGTTFVITPHEVCTPEELHAFISDFSLLPSEHQLYSFTFLRACEVFPLDLGPELYAKVFPNLVITDADQFREAFKAELQKEFDNACRERLQSEMYELLVHTTPIHLPVAFLKKQLLANNEEGVTSRNIDEKYGRYEHEIRWQLISEQILGHFKVTVTREEIVTDIKARLSAYYGFDMTEDVPWANSYVEKAMTDPKLVEETQNRIITFKLFSILEQIFTLEVVEINEKEYMELPHPHTQYHHDHEHAH